MWSESSTARLTIRGMTLFALCLLLPILFLCAFVTDRWLDAERQRADEAMATVASNVADGIDRFLHNQTTVLRMLATSPALEQDDFSRFAAQARELLASDGIGVILADPSGGVRVDTLGQRDALLRGTLLPGDQVVAATQAARVSDVIRLDSTGASVIAIGVPVVRDGRVRYVLDGMIPSSAIAAQVRRIGTEAHYRVSVTDQGGRLIACLCDGKSWPLGGADRPGGETAEERMRLRTATLPGPGWQVAVGATEAVLRAPLERSAWTLAGLAGVLALVALILTATVMRHMIAAQNATLAARLSLEEQERRHLALVDALPQMAWTALRRDAHPYANRAFRRYLGPSASDGGDWMAATHPDDAARLAGAWRTALAEAGPLEIEVRLRRFDGAHRWHKLVIVPVDTVGSGREWLATALDVDDMMTARARLEETMDLLRFAQEAAGAAVWEWDCVNDRLSLAPASARMHGFPVSAQAEAPLVVSVREWEARLVPEDVAEVWSKAQAAVATRSTFTAQFRTRDPLAPGGERWVQTLGRVVPDPVTGEAVRFVGLHLEITARRAFEDALCDSEARLRVSEERLALALDGSEDGLWDWCLETGEVWLSERWLAKLGYTEDTAPANARAWLRIVPSQDRRRFVVAAREHLRGRASALACEHRLRARDGAQLWVITRGRVVSHASDGRPQRLVGTQIDISRRKEAELHVEHMALHDALTGLPNRYQFRQKLDRTIQRAMLGLEGAAVLACDLDRFKAVNDTRGHSAGDQLLRIVAERIQATLRACDTVARLGGDEFAVILGQIEGEAEARRISARLIAAIDEPILLDGMVIDIGISIGVAMVPGDGTGGEEVFRRADTALYEAKAAGRNTYHLFEAEQHSRTTARSLLALDMKDAIRRGDFHLVYQPVIDLTKDSVVSFEALMRWNHPQHGLVSPAVFIPVAEETNLIVPLGAWALKEACREASTWPAPVRVAVNVSTVQFRADLEAAVVAALAASGLSPQRLKLEVTESVLMHDPEQAIAVLHRLRALGVRIALDDFGTGYSSLSYLRRFPFDQIKIDRAFIRDIADPDAAAIVRAIVGIGERLGMRIIAEGVETPDQLERVRQEGCSEVQGYLFSKPLPSEEARTFMDIHRARRAA